MAVLDDLKQLVGDENVTNIKAAILDILDNRIQNRYYVNKHFQNAIMNYFLEDYGSVYLRERLEKQSNREVRRYLSSQAVTQGFSGTKYMAMMNIYLEKHLHLGLIQQYRQLLLSVAQQVNTHGEKSQEYVSQAWKKAFALFVLAHSFDTSNLHSIFDIWNSIFPEDPIHRKRKPNSHLALQQHNIKAEINQNNQNLANPLKTKKISKKDKHSICPPQRNQTIKKDQPNIDSEQLQLLSQIVQTPKTATSIENLHTFMNHNSSTNKLPPKFSLDETDQQRQLTSAKTIIGSTFPQINFSHLASQPAHQQNPQQQQLDFQHQLLQPIGSTSGLGSTATSLQINSSPFILRHGSSTQPSESQQQLGQFSLALSSAQQQFLPQQDVPSLPIQAILGLNSALLNPLQQFQQLQQAQQQSQLLQYFQHQQQQLSAFNSFQQQIQLQQQQQQQQMMSQQQHFEQLLRMEQIKQQALGTNNNNQNQMVFVLPPFPLNQQ